MFNDDLIPGLYETLITERLSGKLRDRDDTERQGIDEADQAHVLARHVYQEALRRLSAVSDRTAKVRLANKLLTILDTEADRITAPPQALYRISSEPAPGVPTYDPVRPAIPLGESALLTNSQDEPSLAAELRAEIGTADEVDLLCAFVKWYGLRLVEPELRRLHRRGAPLRVITTTYLGATDRKALDHLVEEFGAEVKIQYDALRTRLHAKAWMFRRKTEYDTAYVGSSNLSRSALLEGVEWNVRLSRVGSESLLQKFNATFETYWNDPTFEPYVPDRDRDRLDDALAEAAGRLSKDRVTISLSGLEVRPYPYQQEMLDAIEAERAVHDRHRNLVVAATGTGKTVIAALDYRRLSDAAGSRPALLFVAHRKEILEQSLRTYREVLADGNFGELYVAGSRPERWEHVFASVQSLTSYGPERIPPDHFSIVVVDEFHHAAAGTYRRLLDHLQPVELLGLTATPERADGLDVREFFGGRVATELRLWDALGAELLCPFHYFAVADNTTLDQITWARGRYDDTELSGLYTGNRERARIIITQLRDKVIDVSAIRALGFCVGVPHAKFMATVFNEAGIPARAVSGDSSAQVRTAALTDLRTRRVNVLFVADLFNEGLDLPEVDTILFLRPTESATVFLQQLGRGLRRTPDKPVLTALDFVGHHRKEFRFDLKLRALTGHTRRGLVRDVERGFPFLPSGCQIVMDKQSQANILENIRSQVANRWTQIIAELRRSGPDSDLPAFLDESGLDLSDILRNNHSWTELRRAAGLPTRKGSVEESRLLRRIRAFSHVDDQLRLQNYRRLLGDDPVRYNGLVEHEQQLARMIFFSLWPDGGGYRSFDEGFAALRREPAAREELGLVVDLAYESARHKPVELTERLSAIPLRIHAHYQREEILAALGYASLQRVPSSFREGVRYFPELGVDALFVTLKKSAADYSPTTMYRDLPISPTLFHWESQSTTSVSSPTGQRYITGGSTPLLFVREQQTNEFGTAPYLFLGPAQYVSHSGDRPIAITWKLDQPMPTDFFNRATVVAG